MSSNYETLYGVGLLDDLHNYFPALLYDSSGFGTVRDVLTYVQTQARNRFDLFSYGQREYVGSHPPRAPVEENVYRRVVRTSFASVPPQPVQPLSTLLRQPAAPSQEVPRIQVELNNGDADDEEEEEEEEEVPVAENRIIANALLSLLNLPATGLTRTYDIDVFGSLVGGRGRGGMDQFLQPVVVRPTPEQIANNTTIGNLVSDVEQACAICQDTLSPEQEGRKLNACSHWFHKSCIDTWLERDVHCPVCRHDIREPLPAPSNT